MKTNELKKGDVIRLRNGWEATIKDNLRGTTRLAEVRGTYTEIGSVYSHDIVSFRVTPGTWETIEHTKAQIKLRAAVAAFDVVAVHHDTGALR